MNEKEEILHRILDDVIDTAIKKENKIAHIIALHIKAEYYRKVYELNK